MFQSMQFKNRISTTKIRVHPFIDFLLFQIAKLSIKGITSPECSKTHGASFWQPDASYLSLSTSSTIRSPLPF
jgi:hypothetical protein